MLRNIVQKQELGRGIVGICFKSMNWESMDFRNKFKSRNSESGILRIFKKNTATFLGLHGQSLKCLIRVKRTN